MIFERNKLIRFAHCDPAGIVFYPRYAELLNEVVEDWFAEGLGVGFQQLMSEYHLAVPVVQLCCDFFAPARLGELLSFRLQVKELGKSSVQLVIEIVRGERVCVQARLKLVLVSIDDFRAVAMDDFWRSKFIAFQSVS